MLSCVWLFATPWTIQSMEFSRPEYWSGWVAISFSRGSSQTMGETQVSHILSDWTELILILFMCIWESQIFKYRIRFQFSSVTQAYPTLCYPMNHSTPGLPVHHQLPEFTETHIHWVGDAIQPSHPLSSPSPPALNPSQHQGVFQWVNSSHEVAKVLEFQFQHQSFQRTPRTDLLQDGLVGSPCNPRDSQESSPTP